MSSFPKGQLISLAEALAHVVECCDSETALIILESAVNHRMISLAQAQEISEQGKKGNRGIAKHLRAGAQSGSESRVRYFFQKNQVIVENQVLINEVGWVDLLVGEKLIIEFDSDAHHSARIDYLNDRNRDKAAIAAGYLVVRLSYPQIWYEWEETQEFLMELVRKNKHREKSASERGVGA
ncbi:MAG: DUF559 domain-containing protein [Actinomycetaceae bacterium]|nr:DUF559 domain-containing protein [Actinomycetaceae bacterium]